MDEPRCNLIVDSCCDLPRELVEVPGVTVARFPYRLSDGEHLDDLFASQTPHSFYESIRKGERPTTAQMPLGDLVELFVRVLESGVPTVMLSFSSALSGNFDTLVQVREALIGDYPDAELYLVDTKLASIAEGLLVYEAIRQRDRGLTAAELAQWAEEARFFVDEQFMVDDLDSLKRGGRLSPAIAFVGGKLDVKPLLDIAADGTLALTGVARGRKKAIKRLAEYYRDHCPQTGRAPYVIVAGSDAPKDVARLRDEIQKIDGTVAIIESSVGPVIGSHVGPGMVAVAFWGEDSRGDMSTPDRIAQRVQSGV